MEDLQHLIPAEATFAVILPVLSHPRDLYCTYEISEAKPAIRYVVNEKNENGDLIYRVELENGLREWVNEGKYSTKRFAPLADIATRLRFHFPM